MAKIKFKIQFILLLFTVLSNLSMFGQTAEEIKDSIAYQKIEVLENEVDTLENKNNILENTIKENKAEGFVLFFIGVFCAYWAQNSNRNPWVWFFCGIFFNVITLVVLLVSHSLKTNQQIDC